MANYKVTKKIRFQHCDPGGIVFTPQYFNLFTEVMEDWFQIALNYSFAKMVGEQKSGIPMMKIVARFFKPSLLGEDLDFELKVKRLRRNNVQINITGFCNSEKRCSADFLLGFATLPSIGLTDLPEKVYAKIKEFGTEIL